MSQTVKRNECLKILRLTKPKIFVDIFEDILNEPKKYLKPKKISKTQWAKLSR